jgi:hypothetical protein
MANKDLFKQAIAEAKSVREAAIANAKEALEESLTPHLKDMLAAKLQEMEDSSVEEEVVNEVDEDEVEEAKDDKKDEAIEEDLSGLETVTAEAEEEEAEDDSEESEDEAEEIEDAGEEAGDDEAVDGDEDLGDLSVDQFKDMIRDIIAQEMGGGADDMGADMDAGDIEGMGDEPELEEPLADEEPVEDEIDVQEEEIDLDELLAELEATVAEGEEEIEEVSTAQSTEVQDTTDSQAQGTNINRVVNEEDLAQALETIEQLKKDLHETNLLNSKLLYVNKIFKANNLNEAQKVNIIAAFDKAETVKEVKLVFETVSENVVTKKENVSESKIKGMASKATGTTAAKPEVINEVSDTVLRMQKLAGIIK